MPIRIYTILKKRTPTNWCHQSSSRLPIQRGLPSDYTSTWRSLLCFSLARLFHSSQSTQTNNKRRCCSRVLCHRSCLRRFWEVDTSRPRPTLWAKIAKRSPIEQAWSTNQACCSVMMTTSISRLEATTSTSWMKRRKLISIRGKIWYKKLWTSRR